MAISMRAFGVVAFGMLLVTACHAQESSATPIDEDYRD